MTPPIRTVVVDDEPLARDKLVSFLRRHPDLSLVAQAGDGMEAVEVIERERPDLVLLDVQMPELDGFEVLGALQRDPLPYVVFVTAYDQYAVRAFEVGALDYLLKPVAPDRFDQAVERALTQLRAGPPAGLEQRIARALEAAAPGREPVERFLVRHQGRSRLVPVGEIDWIEAAGNYLKLHAGHDYHLLRGTMKEVEARLDPVRFVRIHRTAIVNLDRIQYLEPWSHGDQLVVLRTGARLTLSRRFRDRLPRTFGDAAG